MRVLAILALGICVAYTTTDGGGDVAKPMDGLDTESLVDVTPQIPDGPVVQQYQKMLEKKKLDAEIARQKVLMGPAFERGDAKKLAKKRELEMLAEVEIKNRMGRKEVELKKKDKEAKREEKARFDAANARRLERYEKWSQDEVVRNNERLEKLRHHTKGAFDLAKRLFKKKSGSKTTAIESMAKAKAAQQQQLRVGGYLGLKGDQINFDQLTTLNSKLAKAMDEPNDSNLVFAQRAYDKAAQAVTDEQAGFERKELGWKEKAKKVQDEKEAKQIERHDKKLDELAIKVHKEQMTKKNRQLRLDAEKYAQETAEKLRWKKAINDVKAKRQAVIDGELKAKKDFQAEVDAKEKKKKAEAPGLLVNAKEKKYKERSEKYDGSKMSGASAAFIAKRMKFRACEELVHAKKQLKAADKKAGGEEMLGETGEGDVDKEPKSAAFCQNQFKSRL